MPISRRDFLRTGASAAAIAALGSAPRPLLAQLDGRRPEPLPPIGDPRVKALAERAIEAARAAGAAYADVRLTHLWERGYLGFGLSDGESMAVGVRALVDGYWGFASGPVWSPGEMARLGREAVHQAKASALGKTRVVDLAPVRAVVGGAWAMPVKIDPFEVSPLEIIDYLTGLELFAARMSITASLTRNDCRFVKQEKAFASTTGSYFTQRTYRSTGTLELTVADKSGKTNAGLLDCLSPAGVGWELYREQPLRDSIRKLAGELIDELKLPVKPVDVGRYDTVFDAQSVTGLLHETIGPATELDRALGYEANAGGTSYLNDPLAMLGGYQAGAPSLTVTGNRTEQGGCATVQWDDEGVAPADFALVNEGVLTDFQTTREGAGWLKDYYSKTGKPFRSHGCATAQSGIFAPLQHAPNLVMAPGRGALDFDALVAGVARGIAVRGVTLDMDFQHLNGLGIGRTYEVKDGKRVAIIGGAGFLFRAPELWKGLMAVGGEKSLRRYGMSARKGEPAQEHFASVTAPPAVFKQLTVVDPLRKA